MRAREGNSGRSSPRSTEIDYQPVHRDTHASAEHRCGSCNQMATHEYIAAFDPDTDTESDNESALADDDEYRS
eukprot:3052642-Prorocentrum_lima.AAC.1